MKTYFLFIVAFLSVALSYTCNQTPEKSLETTAIAENSSASIDLGKGLSLTTSYCLTCHSADATKESRIAPPMLAVKNHYYTDGMSEEDFVKDMIAFVTNPSKEISKMPNAVEKFNLMPQMSFSEEDITLIAQYIYRTELEKPNWYKRQHKKQQGKQQAHASLNYLEKGKELALGTKAVLGKNLLGAINEKGTAEAVSFCNTEAIDLTQTLAKEGEVHIKRVSDKERNPNNKANTQELAYINAAKAKLMAGKSLKPQLSTIDNKMIAYYPIMTNAMCMQCHGKANDIAKETLAKLNTLYPNDKATGYESDELRGIWVVEMMK